MIKFSNDFKWLMRISVGLALGLYIFYITKPIVAEKMGLYKTENMANEVKIVELQQQLNNVKASNSYYLKKTQELNKQITDLEKRNEAPRKSTVTVLQTVETVGLPGKKHELINKLSRRLIAPAFVQIDNKLIDLGTCSGPARQVLLSWLQFLMLYSELELRVVQRDASKLREGLFQNAQKIQMISQSEGFLFWPIINQLVLYYDKIHIKNDWQKDFDEFSKNNYPLGKMVSHFYKRGYPKSKHACFKVPLTLTATDGLGNSFAGSRITLDEWFYSFWLRRYKERTLDVSYVALKMLQLLSADNTDNQLENLALLSNGLYNAVQKEVDSQALDAYRNVLYGLPSKTGNYINIPVDKKIETNLVTKLYSLLKNKGGLVYSYIGTNQSYLKDQLSPTFWLQYRRSHDDSINSPLVSVTPINAANVFYKKTNIDEINQSKVLAAIELRYGKNWAGSATTQGAKYCNNRPSTFIRKLDNDTDTIYIVNATCSHWTGEGTVGPFFNAVLKQKSGGNIDFVQVNRGLEGVITISDRYVADLDRDGNIEAIVRISAGVSSTDQLVEISRDGMFLVKPLAEYSEGGYESYSGLQKNRILLSKGLQQENQTE